MRKAKVTFADEPFWMPASDLQLDPQNANTHSLRSIEAIARSLLRFGFRKPMVADAKGVVRAGNGTLEAVQWIAAQNTDSPEDEAIRKRAQSLGILRANVKGELMPWVRCELSSLAGDEATAFALADNQTARLSKFDFEVVAQQLKDLKKRTAIDDLGWADFEIEPMLAAEWQKPEIEELPGQEATSKEAPVAAENSIAFSARDYTVVMRCVGKYRATLDEKDSAKMLDGDCVRAMLELWADGV